MKKVLKLSVLFIVLFVLFVLLARCLTLLINRHYVPSKVEDMRILFVTSREQYEKDIPEDTFDSPQRMYEVLYDDIYKELLYYYVNIQDVNPEDITVAEEDALYYYIPLEEEYLLLVYREAQKSVTMLLQRE